MRNLYIISEGRTECDFVKNVLAQHLCSFDWYVRPITLPTGKNKAGVHKGGWRRSHGYQHAMQEVVKVLHTDKTGIYTTFFDYYGFPTDIPCYEEALVMGSPYEKAKLYEDQINKDVIRLLNRNSASHPFLPYVQLHEFEALLFVDADASAAVLANGDRELEGKLKTEFQSILSQFETPEHIDHGIATAPSKRIEMLVPGFVKNKAGKAGFSWRAVQKAGISRIRQSCIHFNEWLNLLENFK